MTLICLKFNTFFLKLNIEIAYQTNKDLWKEQLLHMMEKKRIWFSF